MAIKNVTISDGEKEFTSLIKESITKDEDIVITKRGEPVAVLLSYKEYTDLKKLKTYLKMLDFSSEVQKTSIKAKDIYETSRKELEKRGL